MRTARWLPIVPIALAAPASLHAQPVADFYRGRTVNISVGFGPGGGYDQHARLMARFIGKHIPGEPRVVVKNVPGAASIVLANQLYNVLAKDGTEIGVFNRLAPVTSIIDPASTQFDARKFNWIGSTSNDVSTCFVRADAPAKTIAEARERETLIAGTGPGSDASIYPTLLNIAAGTRFRIINGYQGSTDSLLAVERGEVHGFCGMGWTNIETTRPAWVRDKWINVLVQFGMAKHRDHPQTPLALDLATNERDRQAIEFMSAPLLFARPFAAPPDAPPDRVAALRKAFGDAMKDPDFQAEAEKQKLEIEHVAAEDFTRLLERLATTPRDALERVKAAMR